MKRSKQRGITLIALVITIIVLLILAAVSIATLTGQNGILTRANDAADETGRKTAEEKVAVEVLGSYGEDGNIDYDLLNQNLKNVDGLTSGLPIDKLPAIVLVDGYNVTINEDGSVTVGNSNPGGETGKTDGSFDTEKGVNTPKLGNNMELVIYDEETQEWIKDETNSAYSYVDTSISGNENKSEWANARVTINGVESYFVWIPRYEYKIDEENKTIDVKFIPTTKTTPDDGYIIHPAFTTDIENGGWTEELSGIWIGKYEASQSDAEKTEEDMGSSGIIQVQPNVTSWRNITIGEMYDKAKSYSTELKSHMLKNSEWGAVAYLTYSKYGRNGEEIAINNSNDYITGASGGSANASRIDQVYAYNTSNGMLASSTGNIYGIYDLSGGADEYVTAYYKDGDFSYANSTFTTGISDEYSTAYNGTNVDTDYKLGDATKETQEWNGDGVNFVESDSAFFLRGSFDTDVSDAGVFGFGSYDGSVDGGQRFPCESCNMTNIYQIYLFKYKYRVYVLYKVYFLQ